MFTDICNNLKHRYDIHTVELVRYQQHPMTTEFMDRVHTRLGNNRPGLCRNTIVVILIPGNALIRKVSDGSLRIHKEKNASDYNLFKVYHDPRLELLNK